MSNRYNCTHFNMSDPNNNAEDIQSYVDDVVKMDFSLRADVMEAREKAQAELPEIEEEQKAAEKEARRREKAAEKQSDKSAKEMEKQQKMYSKITKEAIDNAEADIKLRLVKKINAYKERFGKSLVIEKWSPNDTAERLRDVVDSIERQRGQVQSLEIMRKGFLFLAPKVAHLNEMALGWRQEGADIYFAGCFDDDIKPLIEELAIKHDFPSVPVEARLVVAIAEKFSALNDFNVEQRAKQDQVSGVKIPLRGNGNIKSKK